MAGRGEPGEPAVMVKLEVASGKRLRNYGKSPCSMGKLTMSMAMASIAMLNHQRVAGIHASPYLTIEGIS